MKNKNLLIVIIFILLFNLFYIKISADSIDVSSNIKVSGAQVRTTTYSGIRFVGDVSEYDIKDVQKYGMLLAYGETDDLNNFTIDGQINRKEVLSTEVDSVNDKGQFLVTLYAIPETHYLTKISSRAYVVKNDGSIIYSDSIIIRSLYDVAIRAYEEGDKSEFVLNVYNLFAFNEMSLTIDLLEKSLNVEEDKFTYVYSNPNYDIITIIVRLDDGYFFASDFSFKLNGKIVDVNKYTIEKNILTYKFKDPNWTEIY